MRKVSCGLLFFCLLISQNYLLAQKNEIKFGKVTAADFVVNSPVVDSNVNAVVLADIGSSVFEGNENGGFTLVFKRIKRVKVLNKMGFDAADVRIGLYRSNTSEEKLDDCRAITYNLSNGVVTQSKLESKNIFKDQISKHTILRKFTFPDVKEGSIVEYTYTIKSDFLFNLQPWEFQAEYPCLRSEYEVGIPEFFNYVFLSQGYVVIKNDKTSYTGTFRISSSTASEARQSSNITTNVIQNKWTALNVPALKEEPFTSTLDNHIAKIEFQLAQIRFPDQAPQEVMGSWGKVSEELMKDERFGMYLTRSNGWLDDEMKAITKGAKDKTTIARNIYAYVRDNFTATAKGMEMSEPISLKDVYKKRSGNVADINLLLIAMLKHEDIEATPVILSTKKNGYTHPIYPLIDRFNYVICQAVIDGTTYFLDASYPRLGFSRLTADCYNGHARVMTSNPYPVFFEADSLMEKKTTSLFIINDEKGGMSASYTANLGYNESLNLRNKLGKMKMDEYFKDIAQEYSFKATLSNTIIDSLKEYEEPVAVAYDMAFDFGDEDLIYFNPMFNQLHKDNPFKAAERKYPVEMPYAMNEIFILNMDVPKGYKVDEAPKSVRVKLNEDEGMFEYIVSVSEDKIQLKSSILFKKATYTPDDYETLRNFYSYIVKKQGEQIVLKKIK